jgi:hypothetical protein
MASPNDPDNLKRRHRRPATRGSSATGINPPVPQSALFMAMFFTIKAGAAVTWTNTDDEPRIVWSDRGPSRSAVDTDESLFMFDKPAPITARVPFIHE